MAAIFLSLYILAVKNVTPRIWCNNSYFIIFVITERGGPKMSENRDKNRNTQVIKQKIRDRYKGVSEDVLDVIPATPQEDFYKSEATKRVAVYARVSTDDPNQTSSYELQKNHYEDMVNRRANWVLVDIYADEGISGTSLQHRDSFLRMINDCRAGKIDLIVTKSVSRFARNIIDCIGYVRQLKAADPPIGVFFETENIFTLDENSEMSLSFIATLAQEESHTKSEIMNASIEMRFKRGIFLTPPLLGYDKDEDGNLIINEDEAKTVRLIFFSYLYGYSAAKIADALTELERLTKRGNQTWSSGTVLQILTNERYCGDVLARKTFTPNYLNHKSRKNRHDRNQYRQKNHHDHIISREDFFAVQKMIRNAKYGNKGYFPEMHVIQEGILKGYVTVHPRWAGFTEDDYYMASESLETGQIPSKPITLALNKGSIDLSGYELVRTQFMTTAGQISLSITNGKMQFNKSCFEKLPATKYIELLVLPGRSMLAVRRASNGSHYSLQWCREKCGVLVPKIISGMAFLPTLFQLFGWNTEGRYKMIGSVHHKGNEYVILFSARDAVLYVEPELLTSISSEEKTRVGDNAEIIRKSSKKIMAYPANWANSFGDSYYSSCAYIEAATPEDENWNVNAIGTAYKETDKNVTSKKQAAENIKRILSEIGVNDE